MAAIGPLMFQAPVALALLAALPLVWLVTRATPPPPRDVGFPPADLLARLQSTDETPRASPWWLLALRMVALAAVALGLAGPVWSPPRSVEVSSLVIVIDDGWTSAPSWQAVTAEAARVARAATGDVRLLLTAPDLAPSGRTDALPDALAGGVAAGRLLAAVPKAWLPDHRRAAGLAGRLPAGSRVVWFSDGVRHPGSEELARQLSRIGPVSQRLVPIGAVAMTRAAPTSAGFILGLAAAPSAPAQTVVEAADARGRVLARQRVSTAALQGSVLAVDGPLARSVAVVRVAGGASAGGARLLDAFDRRIRTGLLAPRGDEQPLLSDAHYLEAALSAQADVTRGDAATLARAGLDALVLPDTGVLAAADLAALRGFVERGGLLVRFAGPRLLAASAGDDPQTGAAGLLPVALADTARTVSGGLALDGAGRIAPFPAAGPFAGLGVPDDARVAQVAAPASGQTAPQVWASLADGAPLVSAAELGRGLIVLFHTTAGPAWSDVAFSGLQVAMLRRVLARAATTTLPVAQSAATVPLKPIVLLDGFGRARPPAEGDRAILPDAAASVTAGPGAAPGIYEGGGARLVVHAAGPDTKLEPVGRLPGVARLAAPIQTGLAFGAWLLAAGGVFLLADALVALVFAGRLSARWPRFAALAAMAAALAVSLPAPDARAQAASPPPAGDGVQLAFILSGEPATDARARAGLEGLSRILAERTSVEPGAVVGLDPAKDDLARFPLLYWLLPDTPRETQPDAARALGRYMRSGGVVFLDTRGLGRPPGQARLAARAALRGIETPPLEKVPDDHVLTKAFYLLRGFPGRHANASLWVESRASVAAGANDGVSSLILGDGDWASAWAMGPGGSPVAAVEGGQQRRELAWRVGVNVVIYALTGNYKADQVHVPALLERMGPRPRGSGQGGPR